MQNVTGTGNNNKISIRQEQGKNNHLATGSVVMNGNGNEFNFGLQNLVSYDDPSSGLYLRREIPQLGGRYQLPKFVAL